MKTIQKEQAIKLREQGLPINEIAKRLNVAKSSVSTWVREVKLTEEQIGALKEKNPIYNRQLHGSKRRAELARDLRVEYQAEGAAQAKLGEPLHVQGCMLYWGEGAKGRACQFSNSDPAMLKLFLSFVRHYFQVKPEDMKAYVHVYTDNGLTLEEILTYWSRELDLPLERFGKSSVNPLPKSSQQKKPKNLLPYGVVHLRVGGVKIVQHIFGAIQAYGNFTEPKWLG